MNGLGRADHHPGKAFLDDVVAEVMERRGGFKEFTPQVRWLIPLYPWFASALARSDFGVARGPVSGPGCEQAAERLRSPRPQPGRGLP